MLKRLSISSSTCANPLTLWRMHESQILNVGFFTKQILKILGSEIEIEWVFTFVGVLTTFEVLLFVSGQHGPIHHYCEKLL